MITLIDYGSGNIHAIANIYKRFDIPFQLSIDPEVLTKAEKLILPGVGDYDETMKLLEKNGVSKVLNEAVLERNIPILGVCVGMQIMGESSDEGSMKGFGWIKGRVRRLKTDSLTSKPYLPHLGWNSVTFDSTTPLFKNVDAEHGFYFLHSYYFDCENEEDVYAKTTYGDEFACAVNYKNVYGLQFHPEKSHQNGITVFKNFYEL